MFFRAAQAHFKLVHFPVILLTIEPLGVGALEHLNGVPKLLGTLPFDQAIREFDRWTHISVASLAGGQPRRQALIIDKAGTRPFV